MAVVKRSDDVSGELPKTRIVPVGIPSDEEFFLGSAQCCFSLMDMQASPRIAAGAGLMRRLLAPFSQLEGSSGASPIGTTKPGFESLMQSFETSEDILVTLAGWLEPDGGMPGKNEEMRIANSVIALLSFLAHGSTREAGPFRIHVAKLVQYLSPDRIKRLGPLQANLVSRAVEHVV